jgi:hypothetical protein
MTKKSKLARKWERNETEDEIRIEVGTKFYVVDGVRVAKKVGDEWITLVQGWHVEEGWRSSILPNIPSGPITCVEYEPNDYYSEQQDL